MEAIILVGIQGSGKTTFYHDRFFHTHVRLSLDMLRTRHRQRVLMEACLATHQPFVIDNTNVLRSERAIYITAAKAVQFSVIGYYFTPELKVALDRNRQRTGSQLIPEKGVIATYRRLEPPMLDEGFDRLYRVDLAQPNEWVVIPVGQDPGTCC